MNCGLLLTRTVQTKNKKVPIKKAITFQGYTLGPMAFNECPAMMQGAATHCKTSGSDSFSFNQ